MIIIHLWAMAPLTGSKGTLSTRFAAGGFSAVFLLHCMEAVVVKNILLGDTDEQRR